MKHKVLKLRATDLVEDFSIYPRNTIFDGHVADLTEVLRSGNTLPPPLIDSDSKRVIDGIHRRRAQLRAFGNEVEIEVLAKDYENEREMFMDAISLNATHGRRLTTADIARCASMAKRLHITREKLANALQITRPKLKDITATRLAFGKSGPVVLRRPMAHLAGEHITGKQEGVVEHVGGMMPIYHVNRLIALLDSDSILLTDKLIERMLLLQESLATYLTTRANQKAS